MDEAVIPLRAHHGLCLHFFQGKGYSGAFVENMARKKAMLEENPLVRLTDQADEICRACPNNLCGQCESAEKVRRYDRAVLSLCGLTPRRRTALPGAGRTGAGQHSDTRPPGGYLRRLSVDGFMPV